MIALLMDRFSVDRACSGVADNFRQRNQGKGTRLRARAPVFPARPPGRCRATRIVRVHEPQFHVRLVQRFQVAGQEETQHSLNPPCAGGKTTSGVRSVPLKSG
jgi:hypothetical protein